MGTIRKRGERYQAQVRLAGCKPEAKSFATQAEAKRWVRHVEANPIPLHVAEHWNPCLSDLLTRYRDTVTVHKKGRLQETNRINRLLREHPDLVAKRVRDLTPSMLVKFRDERLKDGSVATRHDLIIIQTCLNTAMLEWDLHLTENPLKRVRKPSPSKPRERRLEQGELEKLETGCSATSNPYLWPMIVLAIETGMRKSELLGLTWQNVDLQRRTAFLPDTKNGCSRVVPLTGVAVAILESLRGPKSDRVLPIKVEAFNTAWGRLIARTGIEDLRFHDLRHEAISRFFELGLNVPEVASISGHKTLAMLQRYTHVRVENVLRKLG